MVSRRNVLWGGLGLIGGLVTKFVPTAEESPEPIKENSGQPYAGPVDVMDWLWDGKEPHERVDDRSKFKEVVNALQSSPEWIAKKVITPAGELERFGFQSIDGWDLSKVTDFTNFGVPQRYDWPDVTPEVEPKHEITVKLECSNTSATYIRYYHEPFYSRRTRNLNLSPPSVFDGI